MCIRDSRPSRLNGLRHLALLVPNLEECERFYVDVLGMEVLNRANEDLVYLTCGNDNLSLGRAHAASNGLQTMDHYGFVVDSVEELEAWYRYLKALGVTLLDPAGNKVQPLYHPAVSGQRLA
ncbi:VOC family protein [Pseudomonas aeruginosa]|nr:VOC family protein [Pseudomonas aeruginosa]